MTRLLRIAFAGASGTGKSRLVEKVAKDYALPVCPIGSRSVSKAMGFANPYDVDAAGKRAEFQLRLLQEKRSWEWLKDGRPFSFVTDRTHFDNLAYSALHSVSISEEILETYLEGMGRYTHVFYLPLDVHQNLSDDPMRKQDAVYHEMFDLLLWGLLQKHVHRLRLFPLRMPLERRYDDVKKILEYTA